MWIFALGEERGLAMKISYLRIKNFKSIKETVIDNIDDVLILVGRNNSGKSVILDAIRAVSGDYCITQNDFYSTEGNIIIEVHLIGEAYFEVAKDPLRRFILRILQKKKYIHILIQKNT